jgi:uncharacterized protein YneF (UPF0154 family)
VKAKMVMILVVGMVCLLGVIVVGDFYIAILKAGPQMKA